MTVATMAGLPTPRGTPTTSEQRRERAIARTREDILAAAARAFAASGFQAATMRDIAREAGYTPPALYTYFASKQEILRALVDQVTEDFQETLDEPVSASAPFPERLHALLRRQTEVFLARSSVLATLFSLPPAEFCALHGGDPGEHPRERQNRRLARWLTEHATADELCGRDPEDAASILDAVGLALIRRLRLQRAAPEPTVLADRILDWFLNGLRGSSAPAAVSSAGDACAERGDA